MSSVKAYAAINSSSPLVPLQIQRRSLKEHDGQVEILYCGVCHIYIPLASESIEKLHLNGEGADDCLCSGCLLKTHINLVKLV